MRRLPNVLEIEHQIARLAIRLAGKFLVQDSPIANYLSTNLWIYMVGYLLEATMQMSLCSI
jgi:hypothetical protein